MRKRTAVRVALQLLLMVQVVLVANSDPALPGACASPSPELAAAQPTASPHIVPTTSTAASPALALASASASTGPGHRKPPGAKTANAPGPAFRTGSKQKPGVGGTTARAADGQKDLQKLLQLCSTLWSLAGSGTAVVQPGPMSRGSAIAAASQSGSTRSGPVRHGPARSGSSPGPAGATPRPPLLHSIWVNFHPYDPARPSNAVLGPAWRLVAGEAWMWQDFGGAMACLSPGTLVPYRLIGAVMQPCHITPTAPC